MTKKRRNYSKQFKVDAVKLVTKQGYKISEAARNLGIDPNVLQRWNRIFQMKSLTLAVEPREWHHDASLLGAGCPPESTRTLLIDGA